MFENLSITRKISKRENKRERKELMLSENRTVKEIIFREIIVGRKSSTIHKSVWTLQRIHLTRKFRLQWKFIYIYIYVHTKYNNETMESNFTWIFVFYKKIIRNSENFHFIFCTITNLRLKEWRYDILNNDFISSQWLFR